MKDDQIGIRGLGTALLERLTAPGGRESQTATEGLPVSDLDGFCLAPHVVKLAARAARRALADAALTPSEVDAMLYAGVLAQAQENLGSRSETKGSGASGDPAKLLQDELGLKGASVSRLSLQRGTGMFDALRTARALLTAEPRRSHVLCVGADALPAAGCREILYNVINDAACAVVVSRVGARQRWAGFHQIYKGYSWDTPFNEGEVIAAYFPTARAVITELLAEAQLQPRQVDLVVPTAANATSGPLLLRLCGIPEERLYQPRHRFGHTSATDGFLFLEEAEVTGRLRPGMRVLLFTFGFGANWCALLLEVVGAAATRKRSLNPGRKRPLNPGGTP